MEIRQLTVFLKVCEMGSFTEAAKVLNYAQSTVSDSVKGLEKDLDCTLFERIGKRIYLTAKGELLREKAVSILNLHHETFAMLNKNTPRTLKVGITESLSTYKFPTFFRTFIEEHHNLSINFIIARCEEIHQFILEHQIDIGFTLDDEVRDSRVNATTLFEEEIVFVKGAQSAIPDSALDLSEEKYLLSKGHTGYNRLFYEFFDTHDVTLGTSILMESIEGIKSYVKQGFGFSFMPYATVAMELEKNEMKKVQTEKKFIQYVQILIHKDKHLSDDLKNLIAFAQAAYGGKG
ncbi:MULTISPECIES: LysR family transcriptional regulator [unclassified Fusibacter]|uniref:LysR family transcriptional regulator n=1 Tax=unclassified Fusibacter TaxID=2624464 RepID=UPI0010103D14|nr:MULTISPECIES: LysR family transcriptional regulator [unclassified Fusibacter]MCK8060728.1 LysR family transcriptional regulator [Fusibacter sp. A2]NPE23023.1 LysR family transcriptional regulator [Fusibacter sp. A1]RXV59697.1 LysR family transcriptional regulator [Fusibacter sp. A1]